MVLLSPRIHFYEINDQSWFPQYFRSKVQDVLTLLWQLDLPFIQPSSPAALVAKTLQDVLGDSISNYTYVDFCAGAGGPTPFIEKDLNARLSIAHANDPNRQLTNGDNTYDEQGVDFVLTDIAPHLEAWQDLSKKSDNIHYISSSVDATNAPRDLLKPFLKKGSSFKARQKIFRLFNLAFHHFPDPLAAKILQNSLDTSDGFGIFELQGRTISSMITCSLMWPLILLVSPYYFWRSPGHLFFTYIIPIIPFVVVVDGYTSSLRTRTGPEIMALMGNKVSGWEFRWGHECHTWPTGEMTYFIGVKGTQ